MEAKKKMVVLNRLGFRGDIALPVNNDRWPIIEVERHRINDARRSNLTVVLLTQAALLQS
jgi:hypothetical protein